MAKTEQHAAPRLLDLKTAALYLGPSHWTVRDLVLAGKLPSVDSVSSIRRRRKLRRILADRHDLDALIEQSKEINVA